MTDQELKYLRALQPKIVKAMGFPQDDDRGFHERYGCGVCNFTHWHFRDYLLKVIYIYSEANNEVIRIPLAIDPENPERGLWGMLTEDEKERFELSTVNKVTHVSSWNSWDQFRWTEKGKTPYLALLRALAAQWGVEVKD